MKKKKNGSFVPWSSFKAVVAVVKQRQKKKKKDIGSFEGKQKKR